MEASLEALVGLDVKKLLFMTDTAVVDSRLKPYWQVCKSRPKTKNTQASEPCAAGCEGCCGAGQLLQASHSGVSRFKGCIPYKKPQALNLSKALSCSP